MMMRFLILFRFYLLFFVFSAVCLSAMYGQTYTAANYAAVGDTFYMSRAQAGVYKYDTTGTNITWNYANIGGVSQRKVVFRAPTQTGFTNIQFPYIFNSNNTNLSSTDGQTQVFSAVGLQISNINDYFKQGTADLRQVASAYDLVYNGIPLALKNTYTSADILYKFPLALGNVDSSTASFTTSIIGIFYQYELKKRKNVVDGTGTITTPFGTFSNALRLVSTVYQYDSLIIAGSPVPVIKRTFREIQWLDASRKYPVMIVTQNLVGTAWVTDKAEYLDIQQYFTPVAGFTYSPVQPMMGGSVQFQNISTNATTFAWNFGDPTSGVNDTSSAQYPTHTYAAAGTYTVTLIASNPTSSDTFTLPVTVYSNATPVAGFLYSPNNLSQCNIIDFTNTSTGALSYLWNFGDTASVLNTAFSANPTHVFSGSGSFNVQLIAINGALRDTLVLQVNIPPSVTPAVSIAAPSLTVCAGSAMSIAATTINGGTTPSYAWFVNGAAQTATTSDTLTYIPANGDLIEVIMTTSAGCVSTTKDTSNSLSVTLIQPSASSFSAAICAGQSYSFNNQSLTTAGTYTRVVPNAVGCDSVISLFLTVKQPSASSITASICAGQSYSFGTQTLTTSGVYARTLANSVGCDSVITLTLTVKQPTFGNQSATICAGSVYLWGNMILNSAGVYTYTTLNAAGCDSIATLTLAIAQPTANAVSATICTGQTYSFGAQTLTTSGVYSRVIPNAAGCDSTITLTLAVIAGTTSAFSDTICSGQNYAFGAQTLTASGVYSRVIPNAAGCDSTITLTLLVKQATQSSMVALVCTGQGYVFGNQTLTTAGNYTRTVQNAASCDSVILLKLLIGQPSSSSIAATICAGKTYSFGTQSIGKSGIYTLTLPNSSGCDSVVTLNLTVTPAPTRTISAAICAGSSYVFGGQSLSAAGMYFDTTQSAAGCDSLISLVLTVDTLPATPIITRIGDTLFASSAGNFQWYVNNAPIAGSQLPTLAMTQNGTYSVCVTNAANCQNCSAPAVVNNVTADGALQVGVEVYPNPAHDVLFLRFLNEEESAVSVSVMDLRGSVLFSAQFPAAHQAVEEISIKHLTAGIYLLRIQTANGVAIQRIVVE